MATHRGRHYCSAKRSKIIASYMQCFFFLRKRSRTQYYAIMLCYNLQRKHALVFRLKFNKLFVLCCLYVHVIRQEGTWTWHLSERWAEGGGGGEIFVFYVKIGVSIALRWWTWPEQLNHKLRVCWQFSHSIVCCTLACASIHFSQPAHKWILIFPYTMLGYINMIS